MAVNDDPGSADVDRGTEMSLLPATLIAGCNGEGEIVFSDVPLSFWGGVDPTDGKIIDRHHPLNGRAIAGRILAIPAARGSCTGSSVMLELLLNEHAPSGLILAESDEILTLGVLIAEIMFGVSIPVANVGHALFSRIRHARFARIVANAVQLFDTKPEDGWRVSRTAPEPSTHELELSVLDRAMLDGEHGEAVAIAIKIVLRMAALQKAPALLDVHRAHIDGCIYTGAASLRFARRLAALGAQVRVPTTLNAISVDRRRWRELGIEAHFGEAADALAQVYLDMGAQATFTCAPYLLDGVPEFGEHVAWAESNAVVFANSILGARTQKYPDFLDICIALTGRAPYGGAHLDQGRSASVRIDVEAPGGCDDAWWPLLGYHVGMLSGSEIPAICGLENFEPTLDDYKAFGAAFATTSAAPMFHIVGCTPEAPTVEMACGGHTPRRALKVSRADLNAAWRELDSADAEEIQLVSLGNPHLSIRECARIAELCVGRTRRPCTRVVLTLGRHVETEARAAGLLAEIERFGATIITDTCWCMLGEPVIPPSCRTLITNSGKYAHYAPGLVNREVQFASLADCITAACDGRRSPLPPAWLTS